MSNDSNKKKGIIVILLIAATGAVISSLWPITSVNTSSSIETIEPIPLEPAFISEREVKPALPLAPLNEIRLSATAAPVAPEVVTQPFLTQLDPDASALLLAMKKITKANLLAQLESQKARVRSERKKDPLDILGIMAGQQVEVLPTDITTDLLPAQSAANFITSAVQLRSLITTNGRTTAWLGINGEIVKVVPRMNIGSITVKQVSPKGVQIVEGSQSRWLSPHLPSVRLSTVEVTNGKQ